MTVLDLGALGYREAWDKQLEIATSVASGEPHTLILVEHPLIHTLGANFHEENLLLSSGDYAGLGIEVARTDRGGDITHHGPGQLVAYPIFRIDDLGKDLHRWLRHLEDTVIQTCSEFGVEAHRDGPTGVWVENRKIASIGIKVRRWVNLHGVALNCNNPLWPFNTIRACGIDQVEMTSLSKETGREIGVNDVKPVLIRSFEHVFELCAA